MNKTDSPIQVLVVDDHPVVRDGLKLMLSVTPDLQWVGQAENGTEAIAQCAALQPDVMLMDMFMPQMDGIAAILAIRQGNPTVRVVALTSFDDREMLQKALRAGAIGYVLKNASMEVIATAIRDAYAGRPVLTLAALQSLVSTDGRREPDEPLTAREQEVLRLMVQGLTNTAIGEQLCVGESTVRFHVGNIFRKLGTINRTQTVRQAMEMGLVE